MLALIGRHSIAPGRAGPGSQQQTVLQSVGRGQLRFLFDEPEAQALASLQLAVIERDLARKHPEQCRLAGAVAPDQPEALPGPYGELRLIKERPLAEGDLRIEKCDQGHRRIVPIRRAMAKSTRLARPRNKAPSGRWPGV